MDHYWYYDEEESALDEDPYGAGNPWETASTKEKDTFSRLSDSARALRIFYIIVNYVSYPICGVGILANIIVLWIWSMEPGYHPTTYLFKALAVADIMNLAFFPIWHSVRGIFVRDLFASIVEYGIRKVGILISMQLAVARTIKLFSPLRAEKLLSRSRMRAVLAGFIVWCFTTESIGDILRTLKLSRIYQTWDQSASIGLTMILPCFFQVGLMSKLVWEIRRRMKVSPSSNVSEEKERQKSRQLIYTVFLMCFVNFIAFPVGSGFALYIKNGQRWETIVAYRRVVYSSFQVVSLINSSINLVFYLSFIKGFRSLIRGGVSTVGQQITSSSFFFLLNSRSLTRNSELKVFTSEQTI